MIKFLEKTLNRVMTRLRKKFGWSRPQLRGYMLAPNVMWEDLMDAYQTGANLFRYQIHYHNWEQFLNDCIPTMDMMAHFCEHHGCKVVFDLHRTPGGVFRKNNRPHSFIFYEKQYQQQFLNIWEFIAIRYKNNRFVWGYDLLNEPAFWNVVKNGCLPLNELYERAVKIIRKHDRKVIIFIEPPFGDPKRMDNIKIKQSKRIWYSVHMYHPMRITHQRIPGREQFQVFVEYPNKKANIDTLEEYLKDVIAFEEEHNTRIYIGEFSCINHAPGLTSSNYILDCIKLFEKHQWPWTYHAWREWSGWSPENSTETMGVLKTFFKNNQ